MFFSIRVDFHVLALQVKYKLNSVYPHSINIKCEIWNNERTFEHSQKNQRQNTTTSICRLHNFSNLYFLSHSCGACLCRKLLFQFVLFDLMCVNLLVLTRATWTRITNFRLRRLRLHVNDLSYHLISIHICFYSTNGLYNKFTTFQGRWTGYRVRWIILAYVSLIFLRKILPT